MDASRVAKAANDPVTRARLDACVFKGAVKNRATGKWETVPMCSMNQSGWNELYAERLSEAQPAVIPSLHNAARDLTNHVRGR